MNSDLHTNLFHNIKFRYPTYASNHSTEQFNYFYGRTTIVIQVNIPR